MTDEQLRIIVASMFYMRRDMSVAESLKNAQLLISLFKDEAYNAHYKNE